MNKDITYDGESYKKRIEMYFCSPTSVDFEKKLEQRAIEFNVPLKRVLLEEFEYIFKCMQEKKVLQYEGEDFALNYFDSHCVTHADIEGVFFSPPVNFGTYIEHGSKHPKLILGHGYMLNKDGKMEFPLTDTIIEKLGRGYEQYFGYKFIGFRRL